NWAPRPTPSASIEEEALHGSPDPTTFVPDRRLGVAPAVGGGPRRGVEAQPAAERVAVQVHRQIRIDEEVLLHREDAGDAVAEIGERGAAHHAAGRLAGDDRRDEAGPQRGRTRLADRPDTLPPLPHLGEVLVVRLERELHLGARRRWRLRAVLVGGRKP